MLKADSGMCLLSESTHSASHKLGVFVPEACSMSKRADVEVSQNRPYIAWKGTIGCRNDTSLARVRAAQVFIDIKGLLHKTYCRRALGSK